MSATTYHKLTLGEWLPRELQRAIWLDCDVLVLRDIASLWRPGSSGRGLFAAQDRRVPLVSSRFGVAAWRELGFSPEAPYFNAGVMLLDLAQWRDQEVGRRALDYVRRYRDRVYFWDQEALNAILAGNWRELDPRWNWHPELDHLFQNRSPGQPHAADAPAADPWIVHFSGSLKPWRFAATSRYRALYNDYLDRTAWTGWRPVARPHHRLLHWYATSNLRRRLYPQEQWATMVLRALTWQLQNGGPG